MILNASDPLVSATLMAKAVGIDVLVIQEAGNIEMLNFKNPIHLVPIDHFFVFVFPPSQKGYYLGCAKETVDVFCQ